jgi:hypothetical protein
LIEARRNGVSDEMSGAIPEKWYAETESQLVCLRCHKTFKREYKPAKARRKGQAHGTKTLLSLWAWHNFRKHLLSCWSRHDCTQDGSYDEG